MSITVHNPSRSINRSGTTPVLRKHAANPIVKPTDMPCPSLWVFNPGAIEYQGETILMMDTATTTANYVFWLARSRDGVSFEIDPDQIEWPEPDVRHPETCVYDPRITFMKEENRYLITYASQHPKYGVRIGLVETDDFRKFRRLGTISEQGNRNAPIFPRKINGMYARLDRPFGNPHVDPASIWLSYSPDLIHWGQTQPILDPRDGGWWDNAKVGATGVPIPTDEGWLVLYHATTKTCNGLIYMLGAALFDLEDPSKLITRGDDAILWPENPYEQNGRVPNVVFSCNNLVDEAGRVRIYYGAADTCIGLAESTIDELVAAAYAKNKVHLA